MASAAVDCRPLRDTNTGSAALATLHTPDTISSPTASAAAGLQRTPGSAKKVAVAFNGHPFGIEAVGRKLSIVPADNSNRSWEKATVVEYDEDLGQHKIRYSSTKQDEWLFLSDLRFKWAHALAPSAPVNPTYRPEYSKEAAVGKRVRVYWPGMQKWYHGTVRSYDPKTDKHMISYKDGDSQSIVLKHEPVMWCDDEPASSGAKQPTTPRHSNSLPTSPRTVTSPRAGAGAAAAFARAQAAAAGTAAANSAVAPASAVTPATAPPPAAAAGRPSAVRRKTIGVLPAAAPAMKAPTKTGRPVGRPPGSTKARSPSASAPNAPRGKSPSPSGPAATAAARSALASSFAGTVFGRVRAAAAGAKQGAVSSAPTGLSAGFRPGEGPVAAAARAHAAGPSGLVGSKLPLTGPVMANRSLGAAGAAAGLLASRQQQLHRGSTLGKHGRDSSGLAADSASKRFKRGGLTRPGPVGAVGRPAAIADKHLAVGCRVAVYWRLDKVFYRGKITSYSPQSGKFTIKYDDGQSEQVMLERERFVWHSPRGVSAGYRPALHSLMQQLGAEGLQPEPQIGVDGMVTPELKGPEGAPHPPISGPGAVGWRIQLYWGADQAWHEADVLSHDEARRKHHVLYLDGEEEWLDLSRENLVWVKATRHGAISAGVVTGDDVPKGRDALGWRIAVYWKDDRMFYEGEIIDFENSTGRHKVLYNDGEEEWLHLRNERVIWRLAPSDDSSEEEDEDEDDIDDEFDLHGSDEEVIVIDGELVTASGGPGRGRTKQRRKMRRLNDIDGPFRARSRGLDSDSASASSGQLGQGPFALAGGPLDDGLGSDGIVHLQQQHYGASAAGYSQNGLQQSAAGGVDANLHLHLKRGPSGGLAGRGGRGYAGKSLGGGLVRQGPMAGRGPGAVAGVAGSHFNLPPLQIRRASGSGEGLGSPLGRSAAIAEHIQLLVRIVPGGCSATSSADGSAAASFGGGVAATAAALQPVLQTLPLQQQRTAARLQRKMDRLQMILGKLATTAGTMGWKLEPQQLPSASLLTPTSAAAQHQAAALGPLSPRARAAMKAGLKGPASPTAANAPMSPRLNGTARAASTAAVPASAAGTGAARSSPQAAVETPVSPAGASKTVPVSKACAVKCKAGQPLTGVNGLARLKVKPSETSAPSASGSLALATSAAISAADLGTQAAYMMSGVQQLQQQQAAYAVSGTAGYSAAMAMSAPVPLTGPITIALPAAMLASPAVMQMQHRLQDPAALAAVAAAAAGASSSAVVGTDIKQPAVVTQALLAGVAAKAQGLTLAPAPTAAAQQAVPCATGKLSPPSQQKAPSAAPAAANADANKAVAAAAQMGPGSPTKCAAVGATSSPAKAVAASQASTATPVSSPVKGRVPAPSYPGVSDPCAPSVQRSADDVVQMLQAMAAAQGSTSPGVQQQLRHMAAAVAAANAAVKSPTKAAAATATTTCTTCTNACDSGPAASGENVQPMEMGE